MRWWRLPALAGVLAVVPLSLPAFPARGPGERGGAGTPADPFTPEDANYMQATLDRLALMLAYEAFTHRAAYVDIRGPSAWHGLCEPPERRWLEGLVPASPIYPYHPNATGMAHAAAIISHAMDTGRLRTGP